MSTKFFAPDGSPLHNPYALLGLEIGASDDDIAKSFKKLMLKLHPDKQPTTLTDEKREKVTLDFHLVMDAKEFLLDGEHLAARREYDSKLLARARKAQVPTLSTTTPANVQKDFPKKKNPRQNAENPKPSKKTAAENPKPSKKTTAENSKPSKKTGESSGSKTASSTSNKSSRSALPPKPKKDVRVKQWGKQYKRDRLVAQRKKASDGGAKSSTNVVSQGRSDKSSRPKAKVEQRGGSGSRESSRASFNDSCGGDCSTAEVSSNNGAKASTNGVSHGRSGKLSRPKAKASGSREAFRAAFNDSCGDCSTTEDLYHDDDEELNRLHTVPEIPPNTKPSSNRPSHSKSRKPSESDTSKHNAKKPSALAKKKSVPMNIFGTSTSRVAPDNRRSASESKTDSKPESSKLESSKPESSKPESFKSSARSTSKVPSGNQRNVPEKKQTDAKPESSQPMREKTRHQPRFGSIDETSEDMAPRQNRRSPENMEKSAEAKVESKHAAQASSESPAVAGYSAFFPAIDILAKQYLCPLTKEVMENPMSDFEHNSYERDAIFEYLKTHSTSPVTGNPLTTLHLTPNNALKEKIRYTMRLKNCLDTLASGTTLPHQSPKPLSTPSVHPLQTNLKLLSVREAMNAFISDLNCSCPIITISALDSSGMSTFTFQGIKFRLEVTEGVNENMIVQTCFEHSKRAAGISAGISTRVVEWNKSIQEMGLGGTLSFRNMSGVSKSKPGGEYVFKLTKGLGLDKPNKVVTTNIRHSIEYFLEMSIKLHNIINVTDQKKLADKVRLLKYHQCD